MNLELNEILTAKALDSSYPYCADCDLLTAEELCHQCDEVTTARFLPREGYFECLDSVIKRIVERRFLSVDVTALFEDFVLEQYPHETTLPWLKHYDLFTPMRELNPKAYDAAKAVWLKNEISNGKLFSFDQGISYFSASDLEKL